MGGAPQAPKPPPASSPSPAAPPPAPADPEWDGVFRVPADSELISVESLSSPQIPSPPPSSPPAPAGRPPGATALLSPEDSIFDSDGDPTDVWGSPSPLSSEASMDDGEESHVIGGRYRIVEGLALGGMGAVFKVTHRKLQKTFALKIILTHRASDETMQRFFFREARVLSKLEHPNIVQITDFGHDKRFGAYLVMEYLHGESLFERLQREERLKIGIALQIGLQIAEALDYMHSRALIHCDIKPENVFLTSDELGASVGEAVKIIDFGLSRSMARDAQLDQREVGGTPAYAAPEQLAGVAPQPSMDIYGVGVLLYAMITGWPPFTGSVNEILQAKRSHDPPRPSERLGRRLDERLESLLTRCLARDPSARPASMAQLIAELRGLLVRMGYVVPESSRERARPVTGRHAALPDGQPAFLERCPMPMFIVGREGRVQVTNPVFCQVLETPVEDLLHKPLSESRLGRIYPTLGADLREATRHGHALLRRIEFRAGSGKPVSLSLWLTPERDPDGEIQRFWGMLMPLPTR